jgi:hypothetical protein
MCAKYNKMVETGKAALAGAQITLARVSSLRAHTAPHPVRAWRDGEPLSRHHGGSASCVAQNQPEQTLWTAV